MRRVSIRELHEKTGKVVREASTSPYMVTERGRVVAILKAPSAADLAATPFPRRKRASMPKVTRDSTDYISRDRD